MSITSNAAVANESAAPQPLYVADPDAAGDGDARARFEQACRARALPPTVTVTVAPPPAARAAEALRNGMRHMDRLEFDDALRALDLAATSAALTGAAGLETAELADIYLFRALAQQKLGRGEAARVWEDVLRAVAIAPDRLLDEGRFPPAVIETWRRGAAELRKRARGTLVVRAPAEARVSIDARPAVKAPAVIPGLAQGQHHLRVEEPGRVPWATTVFLADDRLELDVPERASLELDHGTAAGHGQRRGARFVLTARLRGETPRLELDLIDATAGTRLDGAMVLLEAEGALEAAVGTLVQVAASRLAASRPLLAVSNQPPQVAEAPPPRSERVHRWVTWVAVGTAVVLASVLTAQLASGGSSSGGSGFSATADTSRLGR